MLEIHIHKDRIRASHETNTPRKTYEQPKEQQVVDNILLFGDKLHILGLHL